MTTIRHILVPVDFSEASRAALDYAADMARKLDATVDVLHIYEAPTFLPVGASLETQPSETSLLDIVRKAAESQLDAFVGEARERGIAIRSARAELGPPPQTIVAQAQTGGYDLLVIGTHGRTGLARALIGSVAERVVRHATCPVLTVRGPST